MAKNKGKPSAADILRYGHDIATVKASVSKKRWKQFVHIAHSQGHTVAGQLSDAPNALKERTPDALRKEAQRTVGAAYKPVMADLTRRELSENNRQAKLAEDDAAYRQWMAGEADKLTAQASAADATLATQEGDIARDLNASQQAAHADSLQRVAQQAGVVSDPNQSTALDQTAADTASRERVANQRRLSADMTKVGSDGRAMSKAALIATAAVREATRTAEGWKTSAGIQADRTKAVGQQAADTTDLLHSLRDKEVEKAQNNREFGLAAGELGAKQASLKQDILEANRKYGLDKQRLNLDKWIAEHQDEAAKARLQLGYDQIEEREGKAAADRALRKWIATHSQAARDKKKGVTDDERKLYQDVETARGMISRMHKRGVDPSLIRNRLRGLGVSDPMIDVANDLWRRNGHLSAAGKAKARALGILHVGYFWQNVSTGNNSAAGGGSHEPLG